MFPRQRLREGEKASLAGSVNRFARRADTSRIGRDVHYAATASLDHLRQDGVVQVQRAGQVDGDQLLPVGRRRLEKGLEDIPSGVVDEHVDGPKRRVHLGDCGADAVLIRNSTADSGGLAAVRGDRRYGPLCSRSVNVEHRDFRTLGGEAPASRAPDSPPPPVTMTILAPNPRMFSPCAWCL